MLGPVRLGTTAHQGGGLPQQFLDNRPGFGLPARPTGQSGPAGPLGAARRVHTMRSPHPGVLWAARWRDQRDLAGELGLVVAVASGPIELGGTPGKAVEGRAHPSGSTVWRRWRML
jgi:hypothetical protein